MKVLQILQFLGLMAEKIMFWKQANAKASNVDKKEEASHAEYVLHGHRHPFGPVLMKNTYNIKAHITTSRAADVGFF